MKINLEGWGHHLRLGLKPIYLVSSDEILLQQEARQHLQKTVSDQGYSERIRLQADADFKWSQLQHHINSPSLFSSLRLIELLWDKNTLPKDAQVLLEKLCLQFNSANQSRSNTPEVIVAIFTPKLDAALTRAKWYNALMSAGTHLTIWPIERAQLPKWIQHRLQQAGLTADSAITEQLADMVEGNLLAAAQAIEKLALRYGEKEKIKLITLQQLENTISKSPHYSIFDLVNSILHGDTVKSLTIMQELLACGEETILILWSIAKEIRVVAALKTARQNGTSTQLVFDQHKVWKQRQQLLIACTQRLASKQIIIAQRLCHQLDLAIKGHNPNPVDLLIRQLILTLTGKAPEILLETLH